MIYVGSVGGYDTNLFQTRGTVCMICKEMEVKFAVPFRSINSFDAEGYPLSKLCKVALMMEATRTSETSGNVYQTTRRNIPEDSHLHTSRRENLKSHTVNIIWNYVM
jgi:hypothetical protein